MGRLAVFSSLGAVANRSAKMLNLIGASLGAALGYSVVPTLAPALLPDSLREHDRVGVHFEAARSSCR